MEWDSLKNYLIWNDKKPCLQTFEHLGHDLDLEAAKNSPLHKTYPKLPITRQI